MADDVLNRLMLALQDRYTIERELGRGGMAVVYLAEDVKHHRKVAVKVLRPELAAAVGAERFLNEIRVTANLQHPHILPLFESGKADGRTGGQSESMQAEFLYYVMPYVDGESLREKLNREKQLSVDDALKIASQVADALYSAHRQGVLHRDIKPENILLREGHALVADFGIALAVKTAGGERLTETGHSLGTPAYMSPEQVAGDREIDARSDIYSLACVLYEMLAGEPPFTGPNAQAVLARHMTDPVPPITTVRSSVPSPVATAITKALGKAPADRHESTDAFSKALFASAEEGDEKKKSIVVLPFANLSPDPDNEYFSDGLTDELITELSKIHVLRVISRTSAIQFKATDKGIPAIADELGVQYAVEGTVRRAGNNVRITAQLIDAAADTHLWAERFSGTLEDVFDLQEDLARRIADGLQVTLSPAEEESLANRPIPDARAYDAFLLARHEIFKFSKQGIDKAIELINGALSTIGDNALLYATLSYANWAAYDFGIYHDDETLVRAEQNAAKASSLDACLPQAHYALGLTRYKRGDMQAFLGSAKRAVDLEPVSDALFFLGFSLAGVGKIEEATHYADEAVARDPLFFPAVLGRGFVDMYAGRFEPALERVRDGRARLAPGEAFSGWWLAQALGYAGRNEEALALYKEVALMEASISRDQCALFQRALENDRDGVLQVLNDSNLRQVSKTDEVYPLCLANALTLVGETNEALEWLEQTITWGFTNYQFLSQHNRFLVPLRGKEKFQQLMELARQKQEAFEI
jgi:serine/threonine protein kinase